MSSESLDALEARVREAGDRLTELREENATLRARLEELERAADATRGDGGSAWAKEREQIRKRVDKLTAKLAALLEGAGPA